MYAETIIELAKHPILKKRLTTKTVEYTERVANCGDVITVDLLIIDELIVEIGWDGSGCAISQAAMSLLCEEVTQKNIHDIVKIGPDFITELLGISVGPRRLACAILGLNAIQHAIGSLKK